MLIYTYYIYHAYNRLYKKRPEVTSVVILIFMKKIDLSTQSHPLSCPSYSSQHQPDETCLMFYHEPYVMIL